MSECQAIEDYLKALIFKNPVPQEPVKKEESSDHCLRPDDLSAKMQGAVMREEVRVEESQKSEEKAREDEHKKKRKKLNRKSRKPRSKETNSSYESIPIEEAPLAKKNGNLDQSPDGHLPGKSSNVISFLKKKGKWKFCCEVCEFETLNEDAMARHIESSVHKEKVEQDEQDKLLSFLPEPLPTQITNIDEAVKDIVQRKALSQSDLEQRFAVAKRIHNLVSLHHKGCSIDIVGSTKTGLGLKESQVDLILKVPSEANAADVLEQVHMLISQKDRLCKNVYSEFLEKIPRIQFRDARSTFNITMENEHSIQLAKLLSLYTYFDSRVPILAKSFRAWAHLCDIDDPDKGTLPSFCYVLLLIYFLQHVQPAVLPVLQEVPELLKVVDIGAFVNNYKWHSENQSPVGLLWIKLLEFYSCKYKPGEEIVSICSLEKVTCKDKNWGTKFLAIEDPICHRNMAHVIPNQRVFHYIQSCFRNTYRYFGYPQTKDGPLTIVVVRKGPGYDKAIASDSPKHEDNVDLPLNRLLEDHDSTIPLKDVIFTMSKMTLTKETHHDSSSLGPQDTPTSSSSESEPLEHVYEWSSKDVIVNNYTFLSSVFRGGKSLPLVCRSCQKMGHLKKDCPEEKLPAIVALPKMTEEFMGCISDVCQLIKRENMPSPNELKERDRDRLELQQFIREVYPKAVLQLFGSFCNGFGFSNSDMDLCLTFLDDDGKHLNQVEIIEKLADKLRMCPHFENVIAITSAKVPIVKFFDLRSKLEGDISLYNTLATYNTRMLETYCSIDERVQTLGYVFKYFAKTLGICDASKGSLSSYAYILMVLFFLQQRQPPVIPVLQELYEDTTMPVVQVDGWNAWYFKDISRLSEVWSDYGKNKESVGQLWLGLLSFYASEFNLKEYVISIRQKQLLRCFKKFKSCSKKITIEDPFDLNHNLGSGLSSKMNNYIMKVLIRGREHFGTPQSLQYMTKINRNGARGFLFDRRNLNKGHEPPRDRGCRKCGKIGHVQKDCLQGKEHKERAQGKSMEGSPGKGRSGFRRGNQNISSLRIPEAAAVHKQVPPGFSHRFNFPQRANLQFFHTNSNKLVEHLRGPRPATSLPFPIVQQGKPLPHHWSFNDNVVENNFPVNGYPVVLPQLQPCLNRPRTPQGPPPNLRAPTLCGPSVPSERPMMSPNIHYKLPF